MRTRVLVVLLPLVVLAACGESSGRVLPDQELGKLVLHPADLPKAFSQFAVGREISSELNPVLGRDPEKFGRQNGWVARYRRSGSATTRGPLTVASTVDAFSTNGGANKYFDAVVDAQEETAPATGLKRIEAPVLGDESGAFASASTSPGSAVTFVVIWRERRFAALLSATGFAGRLTPEGVAAFARKQQGRLERAD